jgi:hypothetical protein
MRWKGILILPKWKSTCGALFEAALFRPEGRRKVFPLSKALPGGLNALERLPDPNYWIIVTRFRLNIYPMQVNWSMVKDMIERNCQVEWLGFGIDQRAGG